MAEAQPARIDFFISYTGKDRAWAEWIAMQLEEATYTTIIQAWDFRPGSNFIASMDDAAKRAERTLLVLSPAYLKSAYAFSEWAAAFRDDPKSQQERVLPVRIEPCEVKGLLGPIVYIDLVDLVDEQQARERLLEGVRRGRVKPASVPFPVWQPQHQQGQQGSHERPVFPGSLPPIWNVPSPRNMLFTGRDALLELLAANLRTGQPTALSQPQAISGLGGIGKTQIALEYAYRYRQDYQAVLWAQADTRENLTTAYLVLARLLELPEKDISEAKQVIVAVKRWLQTHTGYLLVLDNADELALARGFLSPSMGGHLVLTTRAQATGSVARCLEVETFSQDQGTLFLLRRVKVLAPDASLEQVSEKDQTVVRSMCDALGGLPLALDQAGAYSEETQCNLSQYLQRYQTRRVTLLKRRGGMVSDHPEPVAITWSLSFEKVAQANPVAAEVVRCCAYLAPDAIPEELITQGAAHLGPVLAPLAEDAVLLDEAMAALGAYSLMRRDPGTQTLSMHRLVQAVLRDGMDESSRQQWAERAVLAVNAAFPSIEHASWPQCERLLPHALVAAQLIEQEQLSRSEAARLLSQTALYLYERARYQEAEPLSQRALAIREQQLGPAHPSTAASLNNLAALYDAQGKYAEAEPLYRRALSICEQQLGPEHPTTATSLNNLALLYYAQGQYEQAEPLYQRALAICEQQLGPEHPDTATSLNNLAALYHVQGKYAEAEPLSQRALAIREQQLGPEHPDTASSLNNLAGLYHAQGQYAEAEPLFRWALAICEHTLGPQHPSTQTVRAHLMECQAALARQQEQSGA